MTHNCQGGGAMRPLTGREPAKEEAPPRCPGGADPPGIPITEPPPPQGCLESCGVAVSDAPMMRAPPPPPPFVLYAGAPLTDISGRSERVLGKRASGSGPGTMA